MKVAIVATHGVIPQAQYGFADQVGTSLREALNAAAALQAFHAISSIGMNWKDLSQDPVQVRSRLIAVSLLFLCRSPRF